MISSVPPEARSQHLQNTSQKRYRYTYLLYYSIKLNICQAYCVYIFIELVISRSVMYKNRSQRSTGAYGATKYDADSCSTLPLKFQRALY
jgi:hypothetical protein